MFVSAATYILLGNMFEFEGISIFETLLFNTGQSRIIREMRMFENAFANAVSMVLLVFGISIAFIFLSGYLWSRERKKAILE